MTRATWAKVSLLLADSTLHRKKMLIDGWRRGDAPLAVTPNTEDGNGWQISHVESGGALWPNRWTLAVAKRLCDQLCAVDGWARPFEVIINDAGMRRRCERIVQASHMIQ